MSTFTDIRLSRRTAGAIVGALVALAWIAFDTGAFVVLVVLTGIGALIGTALDNPQRLIEYLQRLQRD